METLNKTCLKMSSFISKVYVFSSFSASFLWTVGFCTQLPLFLRKRRCDWVIDGKTESVKTWRREFSHIWSFSRDLSTHQLFISDMMRDSLCTLSLHTLALTTKYYLSSVWPAHITTRSQHLISCSGSDSLTVHVRLVGQFVPPLTFPILDCGLVFVPFLKMTIQHSHPLYAVIRSESALNLSDSFNSFCLFSC